VDPLTKALQDVLDLIHKGGLKVFIYDDDGMKYSPVVAKSEDEARRKVLGGKTDDEWDPDHQGLLELDGNAI
jgi:hypothetical protein